MFGFESDAQHRVFWRALLVSGVALIALYFQFLMQFSAGILIPAWRVDFQVSSGTAGVLAASYYFIYLLLQVPAGAMVDRWGARRLLSAGCLVSAVGCVILAQAHAFVQAEMGRVLMGAGLSFAFVGLLYLLNRWFDRAYFAIVLGVAEMLALAMTASTEWMLPNVLDHVGWRGFLQHLGGALVIWSGVVFLWVRDGPQQDDAPPSLPWSVLWRQVCYLFRHPLGWYLGTYAGAVFALITVFSGMWGGPFFHAVHQVGWVQAEHWCSMLVFGTVITVATVGYMAPRVKDRLDWMQGVAWVLAALMGAVLWWSSHASHGVVVVLMLIMGSLTSFYLFAFVVMQNQLPYHLKATGIGLLNMVCMVWTPLLQIGVGWMHDHWGEQNHHPQGYAGPLSLLVVALVLSAVLMGRLKHRSDFHFQ